MTQMNADEETEEKQTSATCSSRRSASCPSASICVICGQKESRSPKSKPAGLSVTTRARSHPTGRLGPARVGSGRVGSVQRPPARRDQAVGAVGPGRRDPIRARISIHRPRSGLPDRSAPVLRLHPPTGQIGSDLIERWTEPPSSIEPGRAEPAESGRDPAASS